MEKGEKEKAEGCFGTPPEGQREKEEEKDTHVNTHEQIEVVRELIAV